MESFQNIWAKIVARSWEDSQFKQRVLKNPREVFKEYGFELPANVEVKIQENTDKTIYVTIPKKPEGELSEEQLRATAAGGTYRTYLSKQEDK